MSDEDKPFKAEYAKSGRSACKQCKGLISKGILRMAKMVQSAHFDGKQPNWYHFACFFKGSMVKDTSDVGGFSSLRWEDQERIRKKMEGAGNEAADGSSSKTGKKKGSGKRVITRGDLTVEYAKSNRSTCKGCNSQIDKDEIRIAKMVQPDVEQMKFASLVPSWHHVDCFLDNLAELEAVGVVPEELSGFTKLKADGKREVMEKFEAVESGLKRSKKKRKLSEDSPPVEKKQKTKTKSSEELAEEKALRIQSKLIWKFRDDLNNQMSKVDMCKFLRANEQTVPKGEAAILDRLADGMAFGALHPCPTCGSQLTISSHSYQCHGNVSEWSKCIYSTDDPSRSAWTVPEDFEDYSFLKSYVFKRRTRVFPKDTSSSQSMDVTDGSGPSQSMSASVGGASQGGSAVDAPLRGFTVYIVGRLSQSKSELKDLVESLGGRMVKEVSDDTTICLSSTVELDKMGKKMAAVKKCDVPVVDEDYLDKAASGAALLKIPGSTISDWGAPRHSVSQDSTVGSSKEEKRFKSQGASKVKVTVKGAAAVDPESELEHSHHVLEEVPPNKVKTIWNAVLGLVDIVRGTNSYYKLQLLESDKGKQYTLFRSWGRVGTTIGGVKTEPFGASLLSAKASFMELYRGKTGNTWGDKGKKVPGKFYPLEIDYSQEDEDGKMGVATGSTSKLPEAIQQLVRMLFDVESMKKAMLEFEIDMKKMPLGKLSKRQMRDAYKVLSELLTEIQGAKNSAKIMDASNRFYTLIPHDFGMKKPPLLDNEEVIKLKAQMVDNLLEIEVAYSLLKDKAEEGNSKDPIDIHYNQLKTDMEVLPKDSEEFKRLVEYVKNTHGATHTMYELEVMEIFKVARHGEEERFKSSSLHNRQLLWHGSRTTNFCGILSQGLRIAPPEAPVTGYMFGKGVYFADMVSKSANYCRTSRHDNIGLMLLCEVALGDMYELTSSEYVEKLPEGKHSTKGLGRTAPDPSGNYTTKEGMVIPMGPGNSSSVLSTALLYNEFIVYDVSQIHMQYLLKMDFKYK